MQVMRGIFGCWRDRVLVSLDLEEIGRQGSVVGAAFGANQT